MKLIRKIKQFFSGIEVLDSITPNPISIMSKFALGGFTEHITRTKYGFHEEKLLNHIYYTFDLMALRSFLEIEENSPIPFNELGSKLTPELIQKHLGGVLRYNPGYYLILGEKVLTRITVSPRDSSRVAIVSIRCYDRTGINKYRIKLELRRARVTLLGDDLLPISPSLRRKELNKHLD